MMPAGLAVGILAGYAPRQIGARRHRTVAEEYFSVPDTLEPTMGGSM
jgi:hypothetical protein